MLVFSCGIFTQIITLMIVIINNFKYKGSDEGKVIKTVFEYNNKIFILQDIVETSG